MEIKINKPVVILFYTIFPVYFGVMGDDNETVKCINSHLHSLLITESKRAPAFKYSPNANMILQSFNTHIFSENRYDPPPDFDRSVLLSEFDSQNLACLAMLYQKLPGRINIEKCGDPNLQSLHMFDNFAKLKLPIKVTEDFCMFMVNPLEYCKENGIPVQEVAKNFADYSDKEIMSKIDHLREYFDYGTKEETDRRNDKMERTLKVCHRDEGELRDRVDKYIHFYSLIKCLQTKIKEKVRVYSSNFHFKVAQNREEFEKYFEPGNTLESVRKAGEQAVTDMCWAFQNLEENLSKATIKACQKDDLEFSNKKALIGHYVRVAVERLNCTENYLKVKVAVNTAPSAPVISMLLTFFVCINF